MENKKIKLDKETSQAITEGEKWARFLKSEEWTMVKSKFMDRLVQLSDITILDGNNPEELYLNIKIQKEVLKNLHSILKEIEGEAHQGTFNAEIFRREREEAIIQRFDAWRGVKLSVRH